MVTVVCPEECWLRTLAMYDVLLPPLQDKACIIPSTSQLREEAIIVGDRRILGCLMYLTGKVGQHQRGSARHTARRERDPTT